MENAPIKNKILALSPHDDDHALFLAFTCMREKPLVVVCFDSYIQPKRGEVGCDAETRAKETEEACKILGCEHQRLMLKDDFHHTEEHLEAQLRLFLEGLLKQRNEIPEVVYAPALQGGNVHHDWVSKVATKLFGDKVKYYTTYTKIELWTKGNVEIEPTEEERLLKHKALACYKSQVNLPATRPHFEAVVNKSEWLQ